MEVEGGKALRLITEAVKNGWVGAKTWMELFELLRTNRDDEAIAKLGSYVGSERLEQLATGAPARTPLNIPVMLNSLDISDFVSVSKVHGYASEVGYRERLERDTSGVFEEPTQAGDRDAGRSPGDLPKLTHERYQTEEELGRGGAGSVFAAKDLDVGRTVALKVLNEDGRRRPDVVERFVTEAKITAQLEHPGIVPVYDVGVLSSGEPFYTMRIVERSSLARILGDPSLRKEFTLTRLIVTFAQVCRAVSFAHARGVIHRDLKPENILIGEYGEVYVTDWGLALITSPADRVSRERRRERSPKLTTQGMLLGTPGYMSPEQIVDASNVDSRADIFSLGAVLYDILTGAPPFANAETFQLLHNTISMRPPSPRQLNTQVPIPLDELCMWCLEREPKHRPAELSVVIRELEDYLEGTKDRERRKQEAAKLVEEAELVRATLDALKSEAERLQEEARAALRGLRPHDDVSKKRPAWEIEVRAQQVELESVEAWSRMVGLYSQALAHEQGNEEAKLGLARLYLDRVLEAEVARNPTSRRLFESLMREYDDGSCAARLRAKAHLTLTSEPPDAEISANLYVNDLGVYQLGARRVFGKAPLERELPPGSWLLVFSAPGFEDARVPCKLMPGQRFGVDVHLFAREEIGEGFVLIPGGISWVGGDPLAPGSLPRQSCFVEDFAMARRPVTVAEYREFLRDLAARDPEQAKTRAPLGMSPDDQREPAALELPICGVNWFDAVAYSLWRSSRDGVELRLPTEHEWEKAARGGDGRWFPWGDRFDPTFCNMSDSRAGIPGPQALGAFTVDISPYGVRDLAGGVREWVADIAGEIPLDRTFELDEKSAEAALATRISRGGSYSGSSHDCRAASRLAISPLVKRADFGIRLVRPLTKIEAVGEE